MHDADARNLDRATAQVARHVDGIVERAARPLLELGMGVKRPADDEYRTRDGQSGDHSYWRSHGILRSGGTKLVWSIVCYVLEECQFRVAVTKSTRIGGRVNSTAADDFIFLTRAPTRLRVGCATWAVLILPYIEQDNLYNQWELDRTYYQQNDLARLSRVSIYFCPSRRTAKSDPEASISGDTPSWGSGQQPDVPGAL